MPACDRPDIILVVDDSADTLRMLTDALDAAGMTVVVALDGAGALRVAEQITPDAILLDAVMPGMDGFETCAKLKAVPRLADVPLIFMTGLSETEDIVRGLQAGGVDYVTKPIELKELVARIRVHLANARLTQRARAALDVAGRNLFAVDAEGRLLWTTPQSLALLEQREEPLKPCTPLLSAPQLQWLHDSASGEARAPAAWTSAAGLRLHYLGRLEGDEYLLRLAEGEAPIDPEALKRALGLTSRESEVLVWISKGKTNRDIAQILGLSTRTIDKHLEQIYAKLGVENRTAAAAMVMQKRA